MNTKIKDILVSLLVSQCEATARFRSYRRQGEEVCLRAFTSGKTYPDARAECAQHGARLATAKTRDAITFLFSQLPGQWEPRPYLPDASGNHSMRLGLCTKSICILFIIILSNKKRRRSCGSVVERWPSRRQKFHGSNPAALLFTLGKGISL